MHFLMQFPTGTAMGTRIADSAIQYDPSLLGTSLKMLAALGIVLGILLLSAYVVKRLVKRNGGPSSDMLVRVLSSTAIGVKKNIILVEVPGAVLVVGVCNDMMCLLSKIEDEETLRCIRKPNGGTAVSPFAAHLRDFSARFRIGKEVQ